MVPEVAVLVGRVLAMVPEEQMEKVAAEAEVVIITPTQERVVMVLSLSEDPHLIRLLTIT